MKTSLSKSRYTKYCQCPKGLWLSVNKPEEATVDAGVEARFAEGNVVGDLAMGLFGDFVEVTTMKDERLDLNAMIAKTREEMNTLYTDDGRTLAQFLADEATKPLEERL